MSSINPSASWQIRELAKRYHMQAKAAHSAGFGYANRAADQFEEEEDCELLAAELERSADLLDAANPRA